MFYLTNISSNKISGPSFCCSLLINHFFFSLLFQSSADSQTFLTLFKILSLLNDLPFLNSAWSGRLFLSIIFDPISFWFPFPLNVFLPKMIFPHKFCFLQSIPCLVPKSNFKISNFSLPGTLAPSLNFLHISSFVSFIVWNWSRDLLRLLNSFSLNSSKIQLKSCAFHL